MPKRLSEVQVEQYHRDGCVFPIDVMSADEAIAYRGRLAQAESRFPEAIGAYERNNTHYTFKFLDEIVHHEAILDAVEDVIGGDILCWGTVLFIKEADNPAFVSWHQDATYNGLEPDDAVTAWLALSPSNPESGCMRFLPGTHKGPVRTHLDRFGEHNILSRGQTIEDVDESESVDVVLEPGQISLHHTRVVHGSLPNRGDQRRVGIAMQSYLPPHVRQTKLERDYALLVRGRDPCHHFEVAERPASDMSAQAVAFREKVNEGWASFLYEGATQVRRY